MGRGTRRSQRKSEFYANDSGAAVGLILENVMQELFDEERPGEKVEEYHQRRTTQRTLARRRWAMNCRMDKLNSRSRAVARFRVDDAQRTPAALLLWTAFARAGGRKVRDSDVVAHDEDMYGERQGTWFITLGLYHWLAVCVCVCVCDAGKPCFEALEKRV